MAEKLWNMLKLLPSIAASRKSSLITGLARIDENTEELILSLYHLPDPGDFLSGKDATYFAWTYDGEAKEYKKVGELQRKNGLTFGFRRKLALSGDGLFVTAEPKGREVREPGPVILASNPELFYQDLQKREEEQPEIVEIRVTETREIPTIEEEYIEPIQEVIDDTVHEIVEESVRKAVEEPVEEDVKELVVDVPEEPVREIKPVVEVPAFVPKHEPIEAFAKPQETPQRKPTKVEKVREEQTKEENEATTERLKKLFTDFYSDLPADEVVGMIKNRYQHLKDEVNLKEYWEKCKKYVEDFYHETRLHELWEAIKRDFAYLVDILGLDDLWEKIEKLVMDVVGYIDPKHWLHKLKGWLDEIDMHEWYVKGKKYINAILDEVDPIVLWTRIKEWLNELLAWMNIDEIIIWIQVKFRQMRSMSLEEMKKEALQLLKQFVDALKLPELKMAVAKLTIREKLGQVGNFFQKVKETVEKPNGEQKTQSTSQEQSTSQSGKKMNPYFAQRNPDGQGNRYSNPLHPNKTRAPQDKQSAPAGNNYAQMNLHTNPCTNPNINPYMGLYTNPYTTPNPYQHSYQNNNQHNNPYTGPYNNPYIFKPTFDSRQNQSSPYPLGGYGYPQMQSKYACPYMQSMYMGSMGWPCNCCGASWNIGYDAMGNPRYLYEDEDEGYYFITPDGEIIRRS